MAFCSSCGAQIPDGSTLCPACAARVQAAPAGAGGTATTGGMTDNVAGMIAYFTIIPAIIFLVIEPYNKKRFVRFHSFQSIFFGVAWLILAIIASHIPILGWFVIGPLITIAGIILWVILVIKAYGGQMWKLPVIGDMAEKQANAV